MVKRKDGRWQERVVFDDGTVKYFYGHSKAEVAKKISDYDAMTVKIKEKGIPFTDLADEWWENKVSRLADQTALGYKPAYNRLKEYFEKYDVKEITAPDINRWMNLVCHGISHKTARNYLSVTRQIFTYGVTMGYCDSNPARDLSVPMGLKKGKRDFPTDEEISIVKNSYDIPFGDFAYWCLYTGMRRGELLALTWDKVDMENRTITVNASISRTTAHTLKEKSTKTSAGERVIPILDKLYEKITPGEGLVFPSSHGTWIPPKTFERLWDNYRKETGIDITPQCLRLAFATMLYEGNVDEKIAQELMGHSSILVTRDVYTRIRNRKLSEEFSEIRCLDL